MAGRSILDDYGHEIYLNCHKLCRRSSGAAPTNHIGFLPRIIPESDLSSRIAAPARMFQPVFPGPAYVVLTAALRMTPARVALAACQQAQIAEVAFRCVAAIANNIVHPVSSVQFQKSSF